MGSILSSSVYKPINQKFQIIIEKLINKAFLYKRYIIHAEHQLKPDKTNPSDVSKSEMMETECTLKRQKSALS